MLAQLKLAIAPSGGQNDEGVALVEVMTAGAILAAVMLGTVHLWSVLNGLSFDLLLKQKAVLVANGEMERLTRLYRQSGFGDGPRSLTQDYEALKNFSDSDERFIYAAGSVGASFVVTSYASFAASDDLVWRAGSGSSARNYVWLDRDRGLLARITTVGAMTKL